MRWDDVNARARGLATHLLTREALNRLASEPGWDGFTRSLLALGYPLGNGESGGPRDTADLGRTVGLVQAQRLALLARWLGARRDVLAVIYEDEERRTLRALLRGAAEGASPTARLRAVVPGPGLPPPVLERLADARSPADLADRLTRLGHPAGRALTVALAPGGLGADSASALGLFGLEQALSRLFAVRATRAARKGGALMRDFASQLIDLENASAILLRPSWGTELALEDVWLAGGRVLTPAIAARLLALPDPAHVRRGLRDAFGGTPLAGVFAVEQPGEAGLEVAVLAAQISWYRGMARRDPLSLAVLIGVVLRVRAEAHDLRAVAWGRSLGAPVPAIGPLLVTAA